MEEGEGGEWSRIRFTRHVHPPESRDAERVACYHAVISSLPSGSPTLPSLDPPSAVKGDGLCAGSEQHYFVGGLSSNLPFEKLLPSVEDVWLL